MRETPEGEFADSLVELALLRGSRDNVTVIGVEIAGQADNYDSEDTVQMPADKDETVPGFTTGSGSD